MRPNEWEDVQSAIAAQWPRAAATWNTEEWATWERVCGKRPAAVCINAVRRLAETLKGYPKPPHLGDVLRGDEAVKGGESKPGPTLEEITKASVRDSLQAQTRELDAMTDGDVRLCLACHAWQMATYVYGPYARSTVSFWRAWQDLLAGEASNAGWNTEVEAEYRAAHPELQVPADRPSLARVFEDFLLGAPK